MGEIDGILLPGGAGPIYDKYNNLTHFGKKGLFVVSEAERINLEGRYFPVLGICLGFELMQFYFSGLDKYRKDSIIFTKLVGFLFIFKWL